IEELRPEEPPVIKSVAEQLEADVEGEQPPTDKIVDDGWATEGLPLIDLDQPLQPASTETPTSAIDVEDMLAGGVDDRDTPVGRSSTLMAARSVEALRAFLEGAPDDWDAHRALGEAMLEAGEREGGLRELESAMLGYEGADQLDAASWLADEVARVDPSVK